MMHHSKMLSLLIEFADVDNCICFDKKLGENYDDKPVN